MKGAVGFNAERGDQVTVANIPFQDPGDNVQEPEKWWNAPFMQTAWRNGLIAMGFLALLFLVIRPMLKMLRVPKPESGVLEIPGEEETLQLIEAQKKEHEQMKLTQLEMIEKVKQDPYQVAQILQNWLAHKD